ncbi:ComEC/Rec2 family competence protein [Conexibacter sp. JD483]|uniref:ComEC/Rec2 family competence protein n=1 Tax=unclassified Conexibacter TaxID=2627773 RepID=UPI0027188C87|nr:MULTISPECIES: ComEC/Rec2 family competence protein [unclassified Conexibacter]MDO8184777.1 ComEC/Rec2 family competence protein [Conexibacter sp. CPCC 205706]MDO8196552.1 ComEC/Rec2 family competence protein [Conexibacter sp. CPCC 205762]MDR9373069.1 ComEC/Rec2 family competence protein [Conexibacter sp. JD483]
MSAAARAVGVVEEALDQLRAHPRHLVLGALVAGLLAIRVGSGGVLLLALTAGALAGRPVVAVAALAAVLIGAIGGQARLAALDRTALTPLLYTQVTAEVTLLEQPRPVQFGSTALASLRTLVHDDAGAGGAVEAAGSAGAGRAAGAAGATTTGAGERVMLRIRQATVWPAVATGGVVRVSGRLRRLGPFEQHYVRKGAHAAITVDAATATGARRGGLWRLVDLIRGRAEAALGVGLAPPQAALLRGMALGQDEALSEQTRDEFRTSGLSHLTAASGANVALLLALALPLLTALGLGLRQRLTAALALIALYVPLAGGGPSIQRAGAMGAATTAAALAGRAASRWYALLLAAAVTLAVNPRFSADPGWQLSFAAVVAIALATPAVATRLRRRRVPGPLADAAAMTFAATLGTAPLLAFHFEELSLVSLPANVLAAPAVAPIMWLGMLAAAVGQFAAPLALPLNTLNASLLGYVGAIAHTAATVPHAEVRWRLPGPLALAGLYAAVAALVALIRWRAPPAGDRW